ncbi:MAG: hypothetical protein IANPNBLG_04129 [Bryobacteraceae bacterium]|nr:hypothetical protein [Bryobacteraceae bacterium]
MAAPPAHLLGEELPHRLLRPMEGSEPIGDGLEPRPHRVQVVQSFLQTEVAQVVGVVFVAQEAG